jgi:hypothetical protein
MNNIDNFFLQTLMTSPRFPSPDPVDDQHLLYPPFVEKLKDSIRLYRQTYPDQDIDFTETYRSNTLQEVYFNSGASKIRRDGMHHYGIAVDCIFVIGGKRTYKGDITLLRSIHKNNGLTILGMWDALHVQFITVGEQAGLRKDVVSAIQSFQNEHALPVTGEPDDATIARAKVVFGV